MIEPIRTHSSGDQSPSGRIRVVGGTAYRCIHCNQVWTDKKQAIAHECDEKPSKNKAHV